MWQLQSALIQMEFHSHASDVSYIINKPKYQSSVGQIMPV